MSFKNMSLADFSDVLASKAAVPGGGGACAYVGSLGTALAIMVGNLTVGKKKYVHNEERIIELMDKAECIRLEFLRLTDEDAAAFLPLSEAYGIAKDDPSRAEIMERCLRAAAAVPLSIMERCTEAIELCAEFSEKGSVLAVSDAGTAVVLCLAALKGAALNVAVNTKLMADRAYAESLDEKVSGLMSKYEPKAISVYEEVFEKMRAK